MKAIIGLGNPGKKYQSTRHNIGFQVVDQIQSDWSGFSGWQKNSKFQAEISEGNIDGNKILLVKPFTFMNDSGLSAQAISHFYKMAPMDFIVVHDEVDLEFGKYKVQHDVSSAGHNGVKSIIKHLSTQMFYRIRVGVGKENKQKQGETSKFVLNSFSLIEKIKLKKIKAELLEEIKELL